MVEEIALLVRKQGRTEIAFYDDMLIDAGGMRFLELCNRIRGEGLHEHATFHCPNALQASSITPEVAVALKATNFSTIRIGFETADPAL
ncbi:MAG: B12-binding domain-containing radical SAM protein, partial [Planctomycetes bacterium]|nr:B12-binding domain-containing radical SAM protein [Planctomycetota bacterium]